MLFSCHLNSSRSAQDHWNWAIPPGLEVAGIQFLYPDKVSRLDDGLSSSGLPVKGMRVSGHPVDRVP